MREILVVYDVRTETPEGQRRLRRVARCCEGLGRRVQKSVFEVTASAAQIVSLRAQLVELMAPEDSIRIYRLSSGTLAQVEILGASTEPFGRPERDVVI